MGRNFFLKWTDGIDPTRVQFAKPMCRITCDSSSRLGERVAGLGVFPFVAHSLRLTANWQVPVDNPVPDHKLDETLHVVVESVGNTTYSCSGWI